MYLHFTERKGFHIPTSFFVQENQSCCTVANVIVKRTSILSVPQTFVSLYIEWFKIMRWLGATPFHEHGIS